MEKYQNVTWIQYQKTCINQVVSSKILILRIIKLKNQLLIESNKKVIVLIKYEFGWKMLAKFTWLGIYGKVYAHIKDNDKRKINKMHKEVHNKTKT